MPTEPPPSERRRSARVPVEWDVDCATEENFLYASITNISELGIFIRTTSPLALGTGTMLSFSPPGHAPFKLRGEVAWVNVVRPDGDNPNPGMGIHFVGLSPEDRERLVDVIRAIAYIREES